MQEFIRDHRRGSQPNYVGRIMAGMVIGGLAGAGTALLFAPQSGQKTRAEIQQR